MLDAGSIIARAEEIAGITVSDTGVRTNLERLVSALQQEGGLSEQGRVMTRITCCAILSAALRG